MASGRRRGVNAQRSLDHPVVGQRHVDAVGPDHGFPGSGRDLRAERLERARLRLCPIPHRHCIAAAEHPFHHAPPNRPVPRNATFAIIDLRVESTPVSPPSPPATLELRRGMPALVRTLFDLRRPNASSHPRRQPDRTVRRGIHLSQCDSRRRRAAARLALGGRSRGRRAVCRGRSVASRPARRLRRRDCRPARRAASAGRRVS